MTVVDTEPAKLVSVNSARVNLNSVTDAKFVFDMKYDEILSVLGNSITENDWEFNETESAVVFHKAYFATLEEVGTYEFTIPRKTGQAFW